MTDPIDQDSAAAAFDELRAEVALLRRAIEGLAAERAAAPDYRPTIESFVQRQDSVATALKRVLAAPALQMTPESYSREIARSCDLARISAQTAISEAQVVLDRTSQGLAAILDSARSAHAQRDAILWAVILAMGGTGALLSLAQAIAG